MYKNMFNWFKRLRVEYKREPLTKGEAGSLARLNDLDLIGTKHALEKLVENTIKDILNSHLIEGDMDVRSVVWKVGRILDAISRSDKYRTKKQK